MSRKILYLLILSVLLSAMGLATWGTRNLSMSTSSKPWIYVPDDKATIQEAVNSYHYDDHEGIFVKAGNYPENIEISEERGTRSPLMLKGENVETTVIDGNGIDTVVLIEQTNYVTITGFTIRNSAAENDTAGIELRDVENCNVTGNIITNNRNGIYLHNSLNCVISINHITNNSRYGIWLTDSDDNMMHGNEITENSEGVSMLRSLDNVIHGNEITENFIGIQMEYSHFNVMHDNNITKNDCGIEILDYSKDNVIYHNNFVDNTRSVYDRAEFEISVNIWDNNYPYGGNYWSNFTGNDTYWGSDQNAQGSDMIIDKPYVIYEQNDERNEDKYPFVKPCPMPDFQIFDFGNYSIVGVAVYMCHVVALTNSSIENFNFNSTQGQISFNLITNISDSCRLIVPRHVLDGVFNFIVDDVPSACSIRCTVHEHMINLTYSQGSYNVKITGEITKTPPITEFPDLNGDGEVNILDIAMVAKHYGEKIKDP